jgi:hypothetical protein
VLTAKMDVLNKSVLPERLKARTDAFAAQRAALAKAVDALAAAIGSHDETKIRAAIEVMHGAYENLEKVF